MKQYFSFFAIFLFILLLSFGCASVKEYNQQLEKPISVEKLRADVDFIHQKLEKWHPKLYWYISKDDLDSKFDSLKNQLKEPLNSYEFFKQVSPVISSIKQGHTRTFLPQKKQSKIEKIELKKIEKFPLQQFKYTLFEDRLYIIENHSEYKNIPLGTEIVKFNQSDVKELLKEYKKYFTSDGYNTTFYNGALSLNTPSLFSKLNNIKDSISITFKKNDSIFVKNIYAKKRTNDIKKFNWTQAQKDSLKAKKKKNKLLGFDKETNEYNRSLQFIEQDSSVAIIKIKSFTIGDYHSFYDETFAKIKKTKSKILILDLRDNTGGRLSEISYLYKFLSPHENYQFIEHPMLTKKTSLLRIPLFKNQTIGNKIIFGVFSPIIYPGLYFLTQKNEKGEYIVKMPFSKVQKRKEAAFYGKMYVLINGLSFSASSIISSNLKGSNRAFFVGEETGGAYNGTIAGIMPPFTLPNSKITVKFGLMVNSPVYKSEIEGIGIQPDVNIIPTLENKINGKDVEMEWILKDIAKQKN